MIQFLPLLDELATVRGVDVGTGATDQALPGIFKALHQIAVAIGGVLEPAPLARLVARHARALCEGDSVGLWLMDDQDGLLKAVYVEADHVPQPVPPIEAGDGLIGRAFSLREPVIVTNYAQWEHATAWGREHSRPNAVSVAVPLLVGARAIGALGVGFPRQPWSEPVVVQTLTLLAAQVAPALEAARLYEAARHELTERARREAELQLQAQLLDAVEHALIEIDLDLTIRYWNRAAEKLYGWTADEVMGRKTRDVLKIPDGVIHVTTGLIAQANVGLSSGQEMMLARRDGSMFPALVSSSPVRGADGKVTGLVTASIDLTELVETKRRLHESEQRFRSMFENHPDAAFAFDREGRVILANQCCTELVGYTREEILSGEPRYAVPEEFERGLAFFRAALRGEPQRFESRVVHKDGHEIAVWVTQVPIVVDGEIRGVFGIARDISDQLQAIEELRAGEQRFRALADNSPDLICRYDRSLRLVYANNMAEMLLGRPAVVVNSRAPTENADPDMFAVAAERALQRVFQTGAQQLVKVELPTGLGPRTFEARLAPEPAADGSTHTVIVDARDVTDRERRDRERGGMYQQILTRQEELHQLIQQLLSDHQVEVKRRTSVNLLDILTARERGVLRLVAQGRSNKQIAEQHGLTTGTVKNVIARILDKLHAGDRTHAAALSVRLGLLDEPPADRADGHSD